MPNIWHLVHQTPKNPLMRCSKSYKFWHTWTVLFYLWNGTNRCAKKKNIFFIHFLSFLLLLFFLLSLTFFFFLPLPVPYLLSLSLPFFFFFLQQFRHWSPVLDQTRPSILARLRNSTWKKEVAVVVIGWWEIPVQQSMAKRRRIWRRESQRELWLWFSWSNWLSCCGWWWWWNWRGVVIEALEFRIGMVTMVEVWVRSLRELEHSSFGWGEWSVSEGNWEIGFVNLKLGDLCSPIWSSTHRSEALLVSGSRRSLLVICHSSRCRSRCRWLVEFGRWFICWVGVLLKILSFFIFYFFL